MDYEDDMTRYHTFNGCDILTDEVEDACYLCHRFELCLKTDMANNKPWANQLNADFC